jgi:TatD DNase family protein
MSHDPIEWVDTHAHLNDDRFDGRIREVVDAAKNAGVMQTLVIGIDLPSSEKAVRIANEHSELFAVVGLQPNSLMECGPDDLSAVERLVSDQRVVAVGETGLDRYWDETPFEMQEDYFVRHLALAKAVAKPVVIHCREAEADTLRVLRTFAERTDAPIRGVMHSYTGGKDLVAEFLKLGLHISFAGMATFKKNDEMRETAKVVPDDRILIETDSPYLAPEPNRGKLNQPAWVVHTGVRLAATRGVSAEHFARMTTANARRLFGLESRSVVAS